MDLPGCALWSRVPGRFGSTTPCPASEAVGAVDSKDIKEDLDSYKEMEGAIYVYNCIHIK